MNGDINSKPLNSRKYEYHKSLKISRNHSINKLIKVERWLNRPLASLFVKSIYHTHLTPDHITYSSFFLGMIAASLFLLGEHPYIVLGGILLQLAAILDSADGMLARAKNICSAYGASLDLFLDRITDYITLLAIVLGQYHIAQDISLLIIGLITISLYFLQVSLYYISNLFTQNKTGESGEARALAMLLIMVFSFLNRLDLMIFVFFLVSLLNNIYRIISFIRLKQSHNTKLPVYLNNQQDKDFDY